MTIAKACQDIFIPWTVKQSAGRVSSSTIWPTLLARWNISRHPMLWRKLCGYENSSTSSEWQHLLLIAPSCCTTTALASLLKQKNQSQISRPSTFCTATIWFERSWIEVTSNFRRSIERRIWSIHLLKPSVSKSSKTINQRWIYDTVPIGFNPSRSCWELYPKANYQSINGWAY